LQHGASLILYEHEEVIAFDKPFVLGSLVIGQRSIIRLLTKVLKPPHGGRIIQSHINDALRDIRSQTSRQRLQHPLDRGKSVVHVAIISRSPAGGTSGNSPRKEECSDASQFKTPTLEREKTGVERALFSEVLAQSSTVKIANGEGRGTLASCRKSVYPFWVALDRRAGGLVASRKGSFKGKSDGLSLQEEVSMISAKYPHISFDVAGVAIIAGTSVRVAEIVLDHLAHQWDAKQIAEHYQDLRLGQIHSALAYYYDHEEERKRDLARGDEQIVESRSKPTKSEILQKLKCLGLLP
jgi:uncharacterized protein (DUF433 family)